ASGFSGYSGFSGWSGYSAPSIAGAQSQTTAASPGNTSSTTGVMMGIAASITPVGSGIIHIAVHLYANATAGSVGAKVQIRHGTGTAPTNGAALTGTADATQIQSGVLTDTPFGLTAIVSGLTLSTAYWIDVSLATITGGTAAV